MSDLFVAKLKIIITMYINMNKYNLKHQSKSESDVLTREKVYLSAVDVPYRSKTGDLFC